jgi:hypothetical protein
MRLVSPSLVVSHQAISIASFDFQHADLFIEFLSPLAAFL